MIITHVVFGLLIAIVLVRVELMFRMLKKIMEPTDITAEIHIVRDTLDAVNKAKDWM